MLLFGIGGVKLVYKHLCRNSYGPHNKQMWKAKMPLKIKIFMWLTLQNSILTKDNLMKGKWKGCFLCLLPPDSLHLISFLNVQSVNMCGAFLPSPLECLSDHPLSPNIGSRLSGVYQMANKCMMLVWLQSVGPFGRQETPSVLKERELNLPRRSSV